MNSTNNRKNHDFQIAYFIAGACHTPDAAYAVLKDCLEERELAIKLFAAANLRQKAKRLRANAMLKSEDDAKVLEGEADIMELDAMDETNKKNLAAAEAERDFIKKCIDKLEPVRKFKHLSDPEAFEAAQREEWKLELIDRASTSLTTQGAIQFDLIKSIRMHPDHTEINKQISMVGEIRNKLLSNQDKNANVELVKELETLLDKGIFVLPDIKELIPVIEETPKDVVVQNTPLPNNVAYLKRD